MRIEHVSILISLRYTLYSRTLDSRDVFANTHGEHSSFDGTESDRQGRTTFVGAGNHMDTYLLFRTSLDALSCTQESIGDIGFFKSINPFLSLGKFRSRQHL